MPQAECPLKAPIKGARRGYSGPPRIKQEDFYFFSKTWTDPYWDVESLKTLEMPFFRWFKRFLALKIPDIAINDEEGFLYCFFKKNGVYFKRIEERMFIHHTRIFNSKNHILGRMANKRLIVGFGVSFYYSVRKRFLFIAFCRRNRLTIMTGAWFVSLVCGFPIWVVIPGTLYLFWKYKFRVRLFLNYSINFLSIPTGFIYALVKKL